MTAAPRCDFCSDPRPVWIYPASDVTFSANAAPVLASTGGWVACQACAELIEADNRPALEDRCVVAMIDLLPAFVLMPDELRQFVREAHAGFRDVRRGAPMLYAYGGPS